MKKISLLKLGLLLSGSLLLTYLVVKACGGYYYLLPSNFTPEIYVDKTYEPLLLNEDFFYYDGYDEQHNGRFNASIVRNWSAYLGNQIPEKVVDSLLLKADSSTISTLYTDLRSDTPSAATLSWAGLVNLKNKKVQDFIEFMYLAKQVESASVNDGYWYWKPKEKRPLTSEDLFASIRENYENAPDDYLKQRYWFQTLKAYFYSRDKKRKVITFFDQTEASMPKNTLYYRALSYKAGVYYHLQDFSQSNRYYAQVFNECLPLRKVAIFSYHPQEIEVFTQSTLSLAQSIEEKTTLWALQGYYTSEEEAIKHIFELDPKSPHLNFLLTRLINHQEYKVAELSEKKTFEENKTAQYSEVNAEALTIVEKIAHSEKTADPFLWNISLGYLQTLNNQYSEADDSFQLAEKHVPNTQLAKNQLRLLRFVNKLNKIATPNDQQLEMVISDLNWLYFELPRDDYPNHSLLRYENAQDWSKKYLALLYAKAENALMYELFSSDNFYVSSDRRHNYFDDKQHVKALKDFMLAEQHSDIERIALKIYSIDMEDIYYYEMVQALFGNQVHQAIRIYEEHQLSRTLSANPFNGYIQDNHDAEHAKGQHYDFLKFLKTVALMQEKLSNGVDIYSNSLLLGNAFYNITHFGNARAYESTIAGYYYSPYGFRPTMKKMITNCSIAKKYYQCAFEAAPTREEKAKCAYMLAKCQRNEYYYDKYYNKFDSEWSEENDGVDFIAWEGFKKLQEDYSDTQYYREVIDECGYFKTYIDNK